MDRVRIQEIALETGTSNTVLIEKAKELGYNVKAGNSTLTIEEADILANYIINGIKPKKEEKPKAKRKVFIKKHAGIVATHRKAKISIREVKQETPTSKIKIVNRKEIEEIKQETTPEKPKEKREIKAKVKEEKRATLKIEEKKVENKREEKDKKDKKEEPKGIKKIKGKRKRLGITVIKKVDKQKPKIRIVNERKPEKESSLVKKSKPKDTKDTPSATPPYKKKKKKVLQSKKDSGEKLNFMTNSNFGSGRTNITEMEEEPEVMMLDFSDKNIYEDMIKQEQKRKEESKKRASLLALNHQNYGRTQTQHKKRASGLRKTVKKKKYVKEESKEQIKSVKIPENIRVYEFAEKIGKTTGEVIRVLFTLGSLYTQNDFLDRDSIEILAEEFNIEVTTIDPLDELDYVKAYDEVENRNLEERPPVITIMGHVDHGKTSLLDRIRKTKVAVKEAGGITQHVGAYQVEKNGKKISFIDTPGHSAFTEMRSRGAQVTDIVILVVAADDGVKKQTKEAISHAKAAGVPIVVAINKMDKANANPELIKSQLAELNITPIEWGGDYEFIPISARTGEGIDELLETLLLTAEVMELKADPTRNAKAVVIESSLEKGFGAVADIIVQNGTLKVGDPFVVGTTYGKVRTMILDDGTRAKKIGPSTPAAIVGLSKVPTAGDILIVMDSEKEAKEIADKRAEYERAKELSKSKKVTIEDLSAVIAEGNLKSLPIIIKTDVQGSLEAIKGSLMKLKNEEVKVDIIHEGVGGISESDVQLANASENSIILGFNVRPTGNVRKKAKELGVEIKTYSVIFELIDDIKALLSGMMSPVISEEATGQAEVREIFVVAKVGTIAGCKVSDGSIIRNAGARVIRDGVVIYDTKIKSLKRFNDDVKEVKSGFECGIMLENFNDIKQGDVIETYKIIEEQAKLD